MQTMNPIFVNEVLQDIFKRWEIKDETIIVKCDNAPTQYKNVYMLLNPCEICQTNIMFA